MAGDDGHVRVWDDGGVRRVEIRGRAAVEHFIDALGRAVELENERPSSRMLLDLSGAEDTDLGEDDIYRVVSSLRRRLRRGAGDRFAVVADTELLERLVAEFVRVRDLLAGGDAAVPTVRVFTELADAETWLAEHDHP